MSDDLNRDLYRKLTEELEFVRAERVQLETIAASRADEIHNWQKHASLLAQDITKLRDELTAMMLERDALKKAPNPTESVALTVALSQVLRGDDVPPNTATVCVLALARLTGKYDWTATTPTAESAS
jgi:predicted nuclease with TOPRIM domain